ncbi:hypothetical protein HJC23_007434 [Cyclotella cryptica]|uniref:Uncharacterized protein n=1 Tax=Cyclotella cryptica TaxID=29204 RepID=A0ABD3QKD5_9STRA|eukprot:CCRYP_005181-RA/>CCRYP_005181-RA protein AED:0.43 eAED:0.43 QI:0/-1/0/1/-1/1/1/0/355
MMFTTTTSSKHCETQIHQVHLNREDKERVDITITIISFAGLHVYETTRNKKHVKNSPVTIIATISPPAGQSSIASVHSLPLNVSAEKTCNGDANWFGHGDFFSSIKFRQHFVIREHNEANEETRYVPSKSSVELAISRNGKHHPLGTAIILINGQENEKSTLNVPVARSYPQINRKFCFKSKKDAIPMSKTGRTAFKFGLTTDATLRVLVHISRAEAVLGKVPSPNDDSADSLRSPSSLQENGVGTLSCKDNEYFATTSETSGMNSLGHGDTSETSLSSDSSKSLTTATGISVSTSRWHGSRTITPQCSNATDTSFFSRSSQVHSRGDIETIRSADSEPEDLTNCFLTTIAFFRN